MVQKRSGSSGKGEEKASDIVPIRRSEFLDEADRMFNQLRREFESSLWPVRVGCPWRAFPPLELRPTREVSTDLIGSEYRVCAEVPGIPKEKIDISLAPRGIEISGEARNEIDEEKEGYVHQERCCSRVYRSLSFREEVLSDKAEATVTNGTLEVRIPKKTPTEAKKRKVPIK